MKRTCSHRVLIMLSLCMWTLSARAQHMIQVSGAVTDAETGAPVGGFWVIPGSSFRGREQFEYHEAAEHHGGEYAWVRLRGTSNEVIRIEADGYLPVVSPILDYEKDSTFDAKLHRGSNIHGRVVTSDDQPADGADVMMISDCMSVHLVNQRVADELASPLAVTDEQGRFNFRPYEGRFDVVVVHDTGRARVTSDALARGEAIQLESWARVEGVLMIGSKPAGAGEEIDLSFAGGKYDWELRERQEYRATTDEDGCFTFDRVHVGNITIGRVVRITALPNVPMGGVSGTIVIKTEPGKTAKVQLGGAGRPVVGKILFPPELPDDFRILQATLGPPPELQRAVDAAVRPHEPGGLTGYDTLRAYRHIVPLKADGSFRIEDVLPGDYVLHIHFHHTAPPSRDNPRGMGPGIARVWQPLTVPEIPDDQTDEPLDLGEIPMEQPKENRPD